MTMPQMTTSPMELSAARFAALAHGRIDHRRKYTGEPYIVHPAQVARIVKEVEHDEAMVCAAWLHDTREDCGVSHEELLVRFGEDVAMLVDWLTDVSKPSDGNRAVRKAIDRERLALAPGRAQTIKLADLIDNTSSIVTFGMGFAPIYLKEATLLLDVLVQGDPGLMERARGTIEAAMQKITSVHGALGQGLAGSVPQ